MAKKKHDITPGARNPIHPGEILDEEFLKPLKLTQSELARELSIRPSVVNEICRGKRGISPRMALLLAKRFGSSPELWLKMQMAWDLWEAWVKMTGFKRPRQWQDRTPLAEMEWRAKKEKNVPTPRAARTGVAEAKKVAHKRKRVIAKGVSAKGRKAPNKNL